jgi:hypothetical protein
VVERDPACYGNCPLQAPQRRRSHSLVGGELRETNPCFFVWFDSLSCFYSILHLLPLRSTWVCYLRVCRTHYPACDHLQRSPPSSVRARSQKVLEVVFCRCSVVHRSDRWGAPVWPVSPVKSSAWPVWPVTATGLTGGALSAEVLGEKEFNLVVTPIHPPSRRH